jgi:uncharacterized integral membrane protein
VNPPLATLAEVATAAPLGFLAGFVVGALLASHYEIVRPRNWKRHDREEER